MERPYCGRAIEMVEWSGGATGLDQWLPVFRPFRIRRNQDHASSHEYQLRCWVILITPGRANVTRALAGLHNRKFAVFVKTVSVLRKLVGFRTLAYGSLQND
jgi:hypothetical protein